MSSVSIMSIIRIADRQSGGILVWFKMKLGGFMPDMQTGGAGAAGSPARGGRTDFAETARHELKTPLATIRGYAETLRDDPDMALAQRQEFLDVIVTECDRLTRLAAAILDAAQLAGGLAEFKLQPADLGWLVEEMALAARERFAAVGVAYTVAALPGSALCRLDERRIRQVVGILLDNALAYTPAGGKVEIALTGRDGVWRLCVRDTGRGIAPADLPRIGERFFRGRLARDRAGAGLGLAIARDILAAHGWHLTIESEIGKGTQVSVVTTPGATHGDNETA